MNFPALLSPIKIGSMEVKNRFVVPPMGSNYANPDGSVSQQLIDYHVARAKGGFGLIIVEVTAVEPAGKAIPFEPGLWSDEFIPGWKKLVDEVHKYGAKIAVQLHHAGRQTSKDIIGQQPVAPSAVPCPVMKEIPRELTTQEVYDLIGNFRDAAVRARDAGFDAVEIHGAHGYLIAQFMSAYSNKRIDEFGGNFISRMKFPLEIIRSIRREVGNGYPLIFRMSGDEKVHGGRAIDETRAIASLVEQAGANAVDISICNYGSLHWMFVPGAVPLGFNAVAAEEVKKSVKIPVIAVGRINDPFLAEDILQSGKADMIALGRESLADPEWPNKVAANTPEEIAPCIACLQGCVGYLFDPEHLKISCLVNPFTGREGTLKIEKTEKPKKVMIVGGGPAGLEAAWVAARRGHQVTLYEKQNVLGGQFRIGGIPSTKDDILRAIKYYITMGKKYGVEHKLGVEVTPELVISEKPDVVILATGGIPLLPDIRGIDNPKFAKAVDVLDGKTDVGEKVLVVGGGIVGAETADFIGEHGRKVTIIEMESEIAKGMPDGPRLYLMERLKEYGVSCLTGAVVKEFLDDGVVYLKDGRKEKITGFDSIVLALGTKSYNPLEEELKGRVDAEIYVVGDAVKARKAIQAIEEGARIAVTI